jgi:hypothetical protein
MIKRILLGATLVVAPFFIGYASSDDYVVINDKIVKVDSLLAPKIELLDIDIPAELGEIVPVKAKISNEYPKLLKVKKILWKVSDNGKPKRFYGEGDGIWFGAGVRPAKIRVQVDGIFTYEVDGAPVDITTSTEGFVQVGNPEPPPIPIPPTPIPPTPDLNANATQVKTWAAALIMSPDKARGCHILSKSFRDASTGNYSSVKVMLTSLYESNNKVLKDSGIDSATFDNWGAALQGWIYKKYQDKELKVVDDYKKLFVDIADGLAAVQ